MNLDKQDLTEFQIRVLNRAKNNNGWTYIRNEGIEGPKDMSKPPKKEIRYIAHWYYPRVYDKEDYVNSYLPIPYPRKKPWKHQKEFLKMLSTVEGSDNISSNEYAGTSKCRICGVRNGNGEYKLELSKIVWVWPEGLRHYVEKHNVLIDKNFINMILEEGQKP